MKNRIVIFLLSLVVLGCSRKSEVEIAFDKIEISQFRNDLTVLEISANKVIGDNNDEPNPTLVCSAYMKDFDVQKEDTVSIIRNLISETDTSKEKYVANFRKYELQKLLDFNTSDSCITCKLFFIKMFGKPNYSNPVYISKNKILNVLNE